MSDPLSVERVAAYILAGGASKRMGRDKALVVFEGEPLALRLARVLGEAGLGPITLVGRQPELLALGLRCISEADAGADFHPLWGVEAALRDAVAPLVLLCPCDLIDLCPADLAPLLNPRAPGVAVAGGDRLPLLSLLPPEMADRARRFAAEGRSARAFVEGLPERVLREGPLRNANREADLIRPSGPP